MEIHGPFSVSKDRRLLEAQHTVSPETVVWDAIVRESAAKKDIDRFHTQTNVSGEASGVTVRIKTSDGDTVDINTGSDIQYTTLTPPTLRRELGFISAPPLTVCLKDATFLPIFQNVYLDIINIDSNPPTCEDFAYPIINDTVSDNILKKFFGEGNYVKTLDEDKIMNAYVPATTYNRKRSFLMDINEPGLNVDEEPWSEYKQDIEKTFIQRLCYPTIKSKIVKLSSDPWFSSKYHSKTMAARALIIAALPGLDMRQDIALGDFFIQVAKAMVMAGHGAEAVWGRRPHKVDEFAFVNGVCRVAGEKHAYMWADMERLVQILWTKGVRLDAVTGIQDLVDALDGTPTSFELLACQDIVRWCAINAWGMGLLRGARCSISADGGYVGWHELDVIELVDGAGGTIPPGVTTYTSKFSDTERFTDDPWLVAAGHAYAGPGTNFFRRNLLGGKYAVGAGTSADIAARMHDEDYSAIQQVIHLLSRKEIANQVQRADIKMLKVMKMTSSSVGDKSLIKRAVLLTTSNVAFAAMALKVAGQSVTSKSATILMKTVNGLRKIYNSTTSASCNLITFHGDYIHRLFIGSAGEKIDDVSKYASDITLSYIKSRSEDAARVLVTHRLNSIGVTDTPFEYIHFVRNSSNPSNELTNAIQVPEERFETVPDPNGSFLQRIMFGVYTARCTAQKNFIDRVLEVSKAFKKGNLSERQQKAAWWIIRGTLNYGGPATDRVKLLYNNRWEDAYQRFINLCTSLQIGATSLLEPDFTVAMEETAMLAQWLREVWGYILPDTIQIPNFEILKQDMSRVNDSFLWNIPRYSRVWMETIMSDDFIDILFPNKYTPKLNFTMLCNRAKYAPPTTNEPGTNLKHESSDYTVPAPHVINAKLTDDIEFDVNTDRLEYSVEQKIRDKRWDTISTGTPGGNKTTIRIKIRDICTSRVVSWGATFRVKVVVNTTFTRFSPEFIIANIDQVPITRMCTRCSLTIPQSDTPSLRECTWYERDPDAMAKWCDACDAASGKDPALGINAAVARFNSEVPQAGALWMKSTSRPFDGTIPHHLDIRTDSVERVYGTLWWFANNVPGVLTAEQAHHAVACWAKLCEARRLRKLPPRAFMSSLAALPAAGAPNRMCRKLAYNQAAAKRAAAIAENEPVPQQWFSVCGTGGGTQDPSISSGIGHYNNHETFKRALKPFRKILELGMRFRGEIQGAGGVAAALSTATDMFSAEAELKMLHSGTSSTHNSVNAGSLEYHQRRLVAVHKNMVLRLAFKA